MDLYNKGKVSVPFPESMIMIKLLKYSLVFACVALGALGVPVWNYFPGYNFRVVEQGAFYGSRQMSGAALTQAISKYGIKTVVNCRGRNAGTAWYDDELTACARAGVAHADFAWSRNSLPSPESLQSYVELLETAPRPFLVHCEGGTHRTGVAAAVYLLLQGKGPVTARGQFGPMFGDAPIGKLVDLFEQSGKSSFKDWIKLDYAADYAARMSAANTAGG